MQHSLRSRKNRRLFLLQAAGPSQDGPREGARGVKSFTAPPGGGCHPDSLSVESPLQMSPFIDEELLTLLPSFTAPLLVLTPDRLMALIDKAIDTDTKGK